MKTAGRRLLREESGYSLVELIFVCLVLTLVLGAVLQFGETTQKIAPKDQEKIHAIREAQVGLHRMTRELRQANLVHSNSAYAVQVSVLVNGTQTRISYECNVAHPSDATYRRCYRYNVAADGVTKTSPQLVVDRVVNPANPVFTYYSNAAGAVTYIAAKVEISARGDRSVGFGHRGAILLQDGFYMRNRDA